MSLRPKSSKSNDRTRSKSLTPSLNRNSRSCKYKHATKLIETSSASISCVDCRRKLMKYAPIYGCKRCKFYLCTVCSKKPACNNGHVLIATHVLKGNECSLCRYKCKKKLQMFHCQACKYRLCLGCFSSETCNGNHGLRYKKIQSATPKNNKYCHKCYRMFKVKHGLFMCKICKFSLCGECYQPTLLMKQKIHRKQQMTQRIQSNVRRTNASHNNRNSIGNHNHSNSLQSNHNRRNVSQSSHSRALHSNSHNRKRKESHSNAIDANNGNANANANSNPLNSNSHSHQSGRSHSANHRNHNHNHNANNHVLNVSDMNNNNNNHNNANDIVNLNDIHSILQDINQQHSNNNNNSNRHNHNNNNNNNDMNVTLILDDREEEKSDIILTDDVVETHNALLLQNNPPPKFKPRTQSNLSGVHSTHSTTSNSTSATFTSCTVSYKGGVAGHGGQGGHGHALDNDTYADGYGYENSSAFSENDLGATPSELTRIPSLFTDCCVCMDREKSVAFMPCGHYITCAVCADAIFEDKGTCAMCFTKIASIVRIYE